jgi:hypothetical protein
VLDLEATGPRTSRHDRVVEVAVVGLDASEWYGRVDPDRPSGRRPGNARRAERKRLTFSVSSEKSGRSGGCLCTPDRCLHGEEDC